MNTILGAKVIICGTVQGVGFRPFVYRLATGLNLCGWVSNSPQGVIIEVEGDPEGIHAFLRHLPLDKPAAASIQSLESSFHVPTGYTTFEIKESAQTGHKTALVMPDLAICPDCLRELFDPENRRYRYPFTNCTHCGPRYSIIEALPYDRPNTTMRIFPMCQHCRAEYENPLDRRFHAQPNACPVCGPHLELWDAKGTILALDDEALIYAANAIRVGKIVAIKGLGGFQLVVDAQDETAVERLRGRKHREEKPFALMMPSLAQIKAYGEVSELEEKLLCSPEAPIVLLRRKESDPALLTLADGVAPRNPYLGMMLPYTPLHHLLMAELDFPIVATSGNRSSEPICIRDEEALARLGEIADLFLVHNRPITRHVDDSVVRVIMNQPMMLRRARGYAPLPVHVEKTLPTMIAFGAHLKNTVAISTGQNIFLSQHIGDLETVEAVDAAHRTLDSLTNLYELHPEAAACDLHPDYQSTQAAEKTMLHVIRVQHHYAHILGCMAEHHLEPPALGIAWDGTGYGLDGTIWGGEFLRITESGFYRAAHLREFRLTGGEQAIRMPRRAALGLLYEVFGDKLVNLTNLRTLLPVASFSKAELNIFMKLLKEGIHSPLTSSAGRLFDAVAALIGLRQDVSFEGQAAMELEFAIAGFVTDHAYSFHLEPDLTLDWEPTLVEIIEDLFRQAPISQIAAQFHNTLVEMIVTIARHIGEKQVILSGGCFQNVYLTEQTIRRLREEQFEVYWPQRIPANDGGIALGQIIGAAREKEVGYVSGSTRQDRQHS